MQIKLSLFLVRRHLRRARSRKPNSCKCIHTSGEKHSPFHLDGARRGRTRCRFAVLCSGIPFRRVTSAKYINALRCSRTEHSQFFLLAVSRGKSRSYYILMHTRFNAFRRQAPLIFFLLYIGSTERYLFDFSLKHNAVCIAR